MKRKFLEDLGIEKETIDKIMAENGADIEKTKLEYADVTKERDSLKEQLDKANETMKGFEDYDQVKADVQKYQDEIKRIQDEQTAKEAKKSIVEQITKYATEKGAKDVDLISSLAKIEDLMASKNQDSDIKSFIDGLADEKNYLFGANEPINNAVAQTGSQPFVTGDTNIASMRAIMGLPAEK